MAFRSPLPPEPPRWYGRSLKSWSRSLELRVDYLEKARSDNRSRKTRATTHWAGYVTSLTRRRIIRRLPLHLLQILNRLSFERQGDVIISQPLQLIVPKDFSIRRVHSLCLRQPPDKSAALPKHPSSAMTSPILTLRKCTEIITAPAQDSQKSTAAERVLQSVQPCPSRREFAAILRRRGEGAVRQSSRIHNGSGPDRRR